MPNIKSIPLKTKELQSYKADVAISSDVAIANHVAIANYVADVAMSPIDCAK